MKNIMKVEQFEAVNQFILEDDKQLIFQSYASIIAVYDKENDEMILGCDWDYSTTTSKYLYKFIDTYFYYKSSSKYNELSKELYNSNNKRNTIKKAIENGLIKLDEELR